jgi:hypothetical protein
VGVDVDVEMGSGSGMEREMNRARVRGADDGYPREAEAAGRRRDWAVWGYCLALFAGMLVVVVVWGLLMR